MKTNSLNIVREKSLEMVIVKGLIIFHISIIF